MPYVTPGSWKTSGAEASSCPFHELDDARCGGRWSLARLHEAFAVCLGGGHLSCPTYQRLAWEQQGFESPPLQRIEPAGHASGQPSGGVAAAVGASGQEPHGLARKYPRFRVVGLTVDGHAVVAPDDRRTGGPQKPFAGQAQKAG
ncbi:MAG: hypothetical protein AAGF84_08890 [Planctomycetota bacterium]